MGILAALLPSLPTILLRIVGAASDKFKADADQIISDRNAKRDIQVAEASPINALMRALIAIGPAIYLFKIFAIDKVLCPAFGGACRTDDITDQQWTVVSAVVGFYFLYDLGVRALARRK